MVRRLGLGKNNHLTYASLALNPRYRGSKFKSSSSTAFTEIDHENVLWFAADSGRAVVNYWQKYMHKSWLTTKRTKPAQKKVLVG